MRYWYDWEFEEDGRTIVPISLGMVSEDNRELYIVNNSYFRRWGAGLVDPSQWLIINVLNKITPEDRNAYGYNLHEFPELVLNFISDSGKYSKRNDIELWGHYAAYDHVCLAQLWGSMVNLPEPIPMFTNDDMTIRGLQQSPSRPAWLLEHNALFDAKFQKLQWEKWMKNANMDSEV